MDPGLHGSIFGLFVTYTFMPSLTASSLWQLHLQHLSPNVLYPSSLIFTCLNHISTTPLYPQTF